MTGTLSRDKFAPAENEFAPAENEFAPAEDGRDDRDHQHKGRGEG
jgi:hypothetical protein